MPVWLSYYPSWQSGDDQLNGSSNMAGVRDASIVTTRPLLLYPLSRDSTVSFYGRLDLFQLDIAPGLLGLVVLL